MNQRDVRAAWEKFVEHGTLAGNLRSSVANSWQRSKNHQVTVDRARAPLVAEAELFRHRSKHAPLRHAARRALENSRTFLGDANSMMILTDPSGLIIDTQGDKRVVEAGRTVHLEHGGRWSEADIGTNAIGAAMAEARAVQIHGAEHFCSEVQRWTCAAVPVHHPADGELLGVVDISGPANTFNPQSMALAVAVGQHVESVLARELEQDRETLLLRYLAKSAAWANDDCVLVDRRGSIVHSNGQALKTIRNIGHIGDDLPTRFLKKLDFEEWPSRLSTLLPNASFDFVVGESFGIGAIIVLHARRRALNANRSRQPVTLGREEEKIAPSDHSPLWPPGHVAPPKVLNPSQIDPLQPCPARSPSAPTSFVAADPTVQAILLRVETAAARKMPILIRGETGTGKEQLARHAHAASGRSGAFVPVNCAALPENLIEAELFGYAEGAFTGARRGGAVGLVKEADGGTLFLDEIGDMPIALQAVLLRLLDDWTVRPLGGSRTRVDIFLVSATNATLDSAIAEGRFRSDLLYRLNTLEVTLPALRDRTDFEAIAHQLLSSIDPHCEITSTTIRELATQRWPGNIRELRNVLARYTLSAVGGLIDEAARIPPTAQAAPVKFESLQEIQRSRILAVHAETASNVSETARRLGVSRNTVYRALGQAVQP